MSDGGPPLRESAVFGGLDAFDDHDAPVDPDAMDRMLLNLATASDPPDWQLDALAPDSDFYSAAPASYPSLPLHYIDSQPSAANNASTTHQQTQLPPLSPTGQPSAGQNSSPQEDAMQVALDGRATTTKSLPMQSIVTLQANVGATSPQRLGQAVNVQTGSPSSAPPRKRPSPPQTRPPAHSGSSTRPRVPTARCSLCGKSISTNGANFRRHEQACRRQRAERVSAARPPSSPLVTGQQAQQQQPAQSPPQPPLRESQRFPAVPQQQAAGLSRRDSDLLNVVRRLESSIGTLDVSARLCLRDALVSLSNKASNPHVPPTPEQEAMNRAAEYLVLRMLFLSGQQVMHTAPGTAGATYPPDAQAVSSSVQDMASRSPQRDRDIAMSTGRGSGEADDGTVAASTGTGGATVVKQESSVGGSPLRASAKLEDKLADGT